MPAGAGDRGRGDGEKASLHSNPLLLGILHIFHLVLGIVPQLSTVVKVQGSEALWAALATGVVKKGGGRGGRCVPGAQDRFC